MINSKPEFHRPPFFRETEPIPQWSSQIGIDIPHDEFIQKMLRATQETQHRYTGTYMRDPTTGNVVSFTRTRLPRIKYGPPPSIEECYIGMLYLADTFETKMTRETHCPGTSRIALGLYEGQHASGRRNDATGPDYSVREVAMLLGPEFIVRPAEVLVTRLALDGEVSYYAEELAEITFPTAEKQKVYDLGDAMKQERFSVEDFDEHGGTSYMVETRWCQEPDPSNL